MMERIELFAFRAPDEPKLCAEFMREHRKVLEDFGITKVTTNNDLWTRDPSTYVIVAQHPTLGMIGGIRLQMHTSGPLPIEEALMPLDPSIRSVLQHLKPHGNGEVCGLWNAHRYANHGVPILLSKAVTAMSTMVNAKRMVCLVAHYTQRHPKRNGFTVIGTVGDNGTFSYPIPSITAIAMVNPDTMTLEHAAADQRQQILSLRVRPVQERLEQPVRVPIMVKYDLQPTIAKPSLDTYESILKDRIQYCA